MDQKAQKYLQQYLATLDSGKQFKYTHFSAGHFCADKENANLCSDLIVQGVKTATCSLKESYQRTSKKTPKPGEIQVVTDWAGNPTSIIEITAITECRFCDVDEEFAVAEGEGDQSLAWWYKVHKEFFDRECEELKIKFSENLILLQERFKVIYK